MFIVSQNVLFCSLYLVKPNVNSKNVPIAGSGSDISIGLDVLRIFAYLDELANTDDVWKIKEWHTVHFGGSLNLEYTLFNSHVSACNKNYLFHLACVEIPLIWAKTGFEPISNVALWATNYEAISNLLQMQLVMWHKEKLVCSWALLFVIRLNSNWKNLDYICD